MLHKFFNTIFSVYIRIWNFVINISYHYLLVYESASERKCCVFEIQRMFQDFVYKYESNYIYIKYSKK